MTWYMRMHAPGRVTLTHADLLDLHCLLHDQRLLRTVFYDGGCRTPGEFVAFARHTSNAFFAVYDDAMQPAAIWWLDTFTGRAAMINFCVFRPFFQHAVDIGTYVCDYCLGGDDPYLDVLYGLTPKCNRAALALVDRLGFKRLAELPRSCDFNGHIKSAILTIREVE